MGGFSVVLSDNISISAVEGYYPELPRIFMTVEDIQYLAILQNGMVSNYCTEYPSNILMVSYSSHGISPLST